MNQLSKQVAIVTGHDCALKRLQSDAISAQVAEHLANGGAITVVAGYAPKARPVSQLSKNMQQQLASEQSNRNKVLQAIADGHNTSGAIAAATGLARGTASRHLNRLRACRKVTMQQIKTERIWSLAGVAA